MLRSLGVAFVLVVGLSACTKAEGDKNGKAKKVKTVSTDTAGTTGADGIRRIPIDAGNDGYSPDKIVATPNEKLVLVFTRTTEARCLSQVHVADGPMIELPVGKPVEVAITAPDKGATIKFQCGMDMQSGLIAVN